ncbi:hypothetical protein NDU88_001328 [Pleurodeles waltl]|uniref:Reverse transcriptase domain-containing protein n=1 Tax=Pleurodeles waltl TaxID=8319 RepID=A0AAV7V9W8_PLEWA|nr:hypothetical protein NDU88_001328 [Pleurodeles waltl]
MTTFYSTLNNYLDSVQLLWLEDGHRQFLNEPFTVEDVIQINNGLPGDKAQGLDGLMAAFYNESAPLLAPHLQAMYEDSLACGILPPSLKEALIVTILKPDKDTQCCGSYRPRSMINLDDKTLANLIASQVLPLLSSAVRPDQSGFVPGRFKAHNMLTFFQLLHSIDLNLRATSVLLDTTRAINSLEWPYLFHLLTRIRIVGTFLHLIKLLYTQPVVVYVLIG